jgi:hypothetical protein
MENLLFDLREPRSEHGIVGEEAGHILQIAVERFHPTDGNETNR